MWLGKTFGIGSDLSSVHPEERPREGDGEAPRPPSRAHPSSNSLSPSHSHRGCRPATGLDARENEATVSLPKGSLQKAMGFLSEGVSEVNDIK